MWSQVTDLFAVRFDCFFLITPSMVRDAKRRGKQVRTDIDVGLFVITISLYSDGFLEQKNKKNKKIRNRSEETLTFHSFSLNRDH